jgi:hypothetical protein
LLTDSYTDTLQIDFDTALVSGPDNGTLTIRANGSETITESFTYRVRDRINFSNLATV